LDALIKAMMDVLKADKEAWQTKLGSKPEVGRDGKVIKKPDGYEIGAQITDCERALEAVAGGGGHVDALVKVVESEAAIAYGKTDKDFKQQVSLLPKEGVIGFRHPDRTLLYYLERERNQGDGHVSAVVNLVKSDSPKWKKKV
jgi:hypothetical protein